MDERRADPYPAPRIDPAQARLNERLEAFPGFHVDIYTDPCAVDRISCALAAGRYPNQIGLPIEFLHGLTPRRGRVLELGAHVGTFTLAAAALGFEVIAVEASPTNAGLLRASLDRNGFDRVRLIHAAVSDRPGTLEFTQDGPFGHVGAAPADRPPVTVAAVAIDDVLAEAGWDRVDYVKIDIEGSEVAGLAGMTRLLSRRDAPPVFIESNGHTLKMFGQTPRRLKAALEGCGYRNYLIEPARLRPVRRDEFQPLSCVDYLAVKGPHRGRRQYMVGRRMSLGEHVVRIWCSAISPILEERRYIAEALQEAPASILESADVQRTIEDLRQDSDALVRDLAQAIELPRPRRDWLARWHPPRSTPNAPHFSRLRGRRRAEVDSSGLGKVSGPRSPK